MRLCSMEHAARSSMRSTQKDEGWKNSARTIPRRKIVVMHDSWSYFAERFGLQIVAAAEPHPGMPPSPAELATLFQRMREARREDPDRRSAFQSRRSCGRSQSKTGAQPVTLFPFRHRLPSALRRQRCASRSALKTCPMTELLLWPFVAGLVLTAIHAWFGLHVLAQRRGVRRSVARAGRGAGSHRCDSRRPPGTEHGGLLVRARVRARRRLALRAHARASSVAFSRKR